ncbi:M56 family metallopeptidase [Bradyrhizobium sp. STM 3557]|uniref:M56 family metallopeptidase n=1 Tax=Bradyrhizobium sp. STM 3557 TaxID=578920 RepID=UPI00388F5C2D
MLPILAEAALRSLLLGSLIWIGLKLCRVRNPQAQMTAWQIVLAASLVMPFVMHEPTVTLTVPEAPLTEPDPIWFADESFQDTGLSVPAAGSERLHAAAPGPFAHIIAQIDGLRIATVIYALVAGFLLLRMITGLLLTWRLARAATPVDEPWVGRSDVRFSRDVDGPVTFASIILFPLHAITWEDAKREAVLAHERAHVANRDFHVLLLAAVNRALFWFSPFAWWQFAKLAELAEIISDAHAIEAVEDRLGYAELLLDMVQARQRPVLALQMARSNMLHSRIERILAATGIPARIDWQRRAWIVAAIIPAVVVCAATIAYRTGPAAAVARHPAEMERKPQHVAFYGLAPGSILAISREPDGLSGQLTGQRRLRLAAAGDGAWSYASGRLTFALDADAAQPAQLTVHQDGRDRNAERIAELSWEGEACGTVPFDDYVGWYELSPSRVVAVTRAGDRLRLKETGRLSFEVAADCVDAFSGKDDNLVIFLRDRQAGVARVLLQDPVIGARVAHRVDAAKARSIEDASAVRMAEVSDHFRAQAPTPGSKELVLRGVINMQRGRPSYDRMSPALAARVARQADDIQSMLDAFGPVETVFFRGVGPGGYDVYGVKFAKGFAEVRILLGADGKAEDVTFRPDGNDEQGEIVGCSAEAGLKPPTENIPIKVMLFNASGEDIRPFSLDADGKRVARGTMSDNTTSWLLTDVGRPMVIANRDGKCLEVLLPGQRTRYHSIEISQSGEAAHLGRPRTAPLPGSEDALRRYIDALAADELDEVRMTPEVAAQTRQQMAQSRAILARLGGLRALSFRAVTSIGTDVYMGHFANGTAEWRIALAKDGSIMRIALGPQ